MLDVVVAECKRVCNACKFSFKGLLAAFAGEAAFRLECFLGLPLAVVSLFFSVTKAEHLLMVAVLVLVMVVELINSAIEAVVDRVGSEHHVLSGRAKDMGSAAVMVSLVLAVAVWLVVLL